MLFCRKLQMRQDLCSWRRWTWTSGFCFWSGPLWREQSCPDRSTGTNWTDGGPKLGSAVGAGGVETKAIDPELRIIPDGTKEDKAFSHNAAFNLEALANRAFDVNHWQIRQSLRLWACPVAVHQFHSTLRAFFKQCLGHHEKEPQAKQLGRTWLMMGLGSHEKDSWSHSQKKTGVYFFPKTMTDNGVC